jgi:hypothetical protein
MSIDRKYSKAKGAGNHVVWTGLEPVLVPFFMPGKLEDGRECGVLRIPGHDLYCSGLRADFGTPSGDSAISCTVSLYTAGNVIIPGAVLNLNGVAPGGDILFQPPVPMPVNSIWKLRVNISSPDDVDTYFPSDMTVTYQLYYSLGPVVASQFSLNDPQQGVGFDEIGYTLEVY